MCIRDRHGAPLPQDEIDKTKKALGLPLEPFYLPNEVTDFFQNQFSDKFSMNFRQRISD